MKKILIASFDMEVGGVERSLISMLNNFDYRSYTVDLMLYSHTGDFMNLLPEPPRLLKEIKAYKTFRMSIGETIKSGELFIGLARILAKYRAKRNRFSENGYKQMQYMWNYALPFLPKLEQKYDIAISYLWPHYFIGDKVTAETKIAWIHTDYSSVDTDISMDLKMWNKFNFIIAVSQECKSAFLKKYSELANKVVVIENLTSPDFIKKMALEELDNPIKHDQRFKVVTVARLSYAKGIDNAVKALKLLRERGYHDIVWYVVGYGGEESKLRELIAQNDLENSFIILGKKSNPYPYMQACDVYIQPSRYEGKAVTVTEAQILGMPILITNYPTASSQIRDNIDGVICESCVEGIAAGIEKMYNSPDLRYRLSETVKDIDFTNNDELDTLYEIIRANCKKNE